MPSSASEASGDTGRQIPRTLVALLLLGCSLDGCAQISSSTRYELEPSGLAPTRQVKEEPWKLSANLTVRPVAEGAMIRFGVRRTRGCEITEITVFEQHRYVRRENQQPRLTALAFGLGVLGTAVVGGALVRYTNGTALSHTTGDSDKLTGTGTALLYATPFSLALLGGVYDVAAATDSSDDLGKVEKSQTRRELCGDEPAANGNLALHVGDRVIAQGTTDGQGAAELLLPHDLLGNDTLAVTVGDAPVEVVPSWATLLGPLGGAGAPPSAPASPSPSSPGGGAVAGATAVLPDLKPEGLFFLGLPLRGAPRQALRAALAEKGVNPAASAAAGPHTDRFDVEKLAPAGLNTLDVLFAHDEHFVGLKLSGPSGAGDEVRLLDLLRPRCGTPNLEGDPGHPRLWLWRADGFEISFAPARADKGPSLVVRDLAALKAATGQK